MEVELPDGTIAEFPDGTPHDVIKSALQKRFANTQPPAAEPYKMTPIQKTIVDSAKGAAAGLAKGAAAIPGLIGDLGSIYDNAWNKSLEVGANMGEAVGLLDYGTAAKIKMFREDQAKLAEDPNAGLTNEVAGVPLPTSKAMDKIVESVTGPYYEPETLPGRMSKGAAEFIPSTFLLPGSKVANALQYGALPGLVGTGAEEAAKGTKLEPYAKPIASTAASVLSHKAPDMLRAPRELPDRQAIKDAADKAYKVADSADLIISKDAMARTAEDIKNNLADFGFHPQLQPRVNVILKELDRVSSENITGKGVDTVRRIAKSAAKSDDASEHALGKMIIAKIDDMMVNLSPSDVIMGDAAVASNAYKEGRTLWHKQEKLGTVEEATKRAANNAAVSGTGGNVDNAVRQQFRSILNSPSARRGFSPDELSAIEDIVKGTPSQNAMRFLGKLSPSGSGLMAALNVGAIAANPIMAIPSAAGIAAKTVSDKKTMKNIDVLKEIIANDGKKTPNPSNEKLIRALILQSGVK
jgi:hypothetical protein